jgi:hypothetical protein
MPEPDAAQRKDRRRTLSDQYAPILHRHFSASRLLTGVCCVNNHSQRWHRALKTRLDARGLEIWEVNPLKGKDYNTLHIGDRMLILEAVCEWGLEDDESARGNDADPEEMRTEPMGTDAEGNIYWSFTGNLFI